MNKEQISESDNIREQESRHIIVYSLQRIINFKQSNRYSYKIHQQTLENKECQIEKLQNYIKATNLKQFNIDKYNNKCML